ncbi:hypothetical protein IWW54_002936, partial [Coemansia sp. RSA 2705]
MSESSNGDGPPRRLLANGRGVEAEGGVDPRQLVSLTPTSSVAVMGLTAMRYGQPEQDLSSIAYASQGSSPGAAQQPAGRMLQLSSQSTAHSDLLSASAVTAVLSQQQQQQQQGFLANALSTLPIGRYLSSLEMYQRRGSGYQFAMGPTQAANG